MLVTSYKRRLASGEIETNPVTGLPIIYSMGGPPDDRLHDDAVEVVTKDVVPTADPEQVADQIERNAAMWTALVNQAAA